MKKILICFILTLVSISGYSQWMTPRYHPADELTGKAAHYTNVYDKTGVGMFIAQSDGPVVKLVTDKGIFDFELTLTRRMCGVDLYEVDVLIGFYEGSTLVEKTTTSFWALDNSKRTAYIPNDDLSKKILEHIKTKGKVRFIVSRYNDTDFDLTVPMNKALKVD